MTVVATDLDGTLLDPGARLGLEAKEALALLRWRRIPVVPLTSKTEEELLVRLEELDGGPFGSFENGAGIVGPDGTEIASEALGMVELARILSEITAASGLSLRPLPALGDAEMEALTGLGGEAARRARARLHDLPFLAPPGSGPALARAAEEAEGAGALLVRGGTFWHLSGRHDKGTALARLVAKYRLEGPIIGLGDAPNDTPFLARCDRVAILPASSGADAELLARFPGAFVAPLPGGAGWARGVSALLAAP